MRMRILTAIAGTVLLGAGIAGCGTAPPTIPHASAKSPAYWRPSAAQTERGKQAIAGQCHYSPDSLTVDDGDTAAFAKVTKGIADVRNVYYWFVQLGHDVAGTVYDTRTGNILCVTGYAAGDGDGIAGNPALTVTQKQALYPLLSLVIQGCAEIGNPGADTLKVKYLLSPQTGVYDFGWTDTTDTPHGAAVYVAGDGTAPQLVSCGTGG